MCLPKHSIFMTKHKTRTAEVTICIISERLLDRPRQLPNSSKLVKVPIGKREGAQVQFIWEEVRRLVSYRARGGGGEGEVTN